MRTVKAVNTDIPPSAPRMMNRKQGAMRDMGQAKTPYRQIAYRSGLDHPTVSNTDAGNAVVAESRKQLVKFAAMQVMPSQIRTSSVIR